MVKGVVASFISQLSRRDWESLPGFFSADALWFTNGNPALVKQAGTKPAVEHLKVIPTIADRFETYSFSINHILSEGNEATIEGQALGRGPADLVYVNNITMAFTVDDGGKITMLREYPDFKQIDWLLGWFANNTQS